ncbi:MAG: large conductance mechanosensitive channel protein MscL [Phycisphaerales bacterium]
MGFIKEFKDFALRGNVMDMAIGIIIGAAFGTIVSSLVKDIVMPPIGQLMGGVDFGDLLIPLDGNEYASLIEAETAGAPVIAYGRFLNSVINFAIVALAIFILISMINKATARFKAEEAAAPPPADIKLLTEIRDELRKRG